MDERDIFKLSKMSTFNLEFKEEINFVAKRKFYPFGGGEFSSRKYNGYNGYKC